MTSSPPPASSGGGGRGSYRGRVTAIIPKAEAINLSGKTVVVGLNAALQKRFVLPPAGPGSTLVPGSVHRADGVEVGVGGKGQDVAVALSYIWGRDGVGKDMALAQFVGKGAEGDAVMSMLGDILGPRGGGEGNAVSSEASPSSTLSDVGWDSLTVRPSTGLRTCTTIVASDCATELVEPSGVIAPPEMEELLSRVATLSHGDSGADDSLAADADAAAAAAALCVMGSMPPGCPPGTYGDVYDRVADPTATACLVDSVAGLGPLLRSMATKRRHCRRILGETTPLAPAVLKLNASELRRLGGVEEKSGGGGVVSSSEADRTSDDDLLRAVVGFLSKFDNDGASDALDYLAVTDGKHPARLVELTTEEEDGGVGTKRTNENVGFVMHRLHVVDLFDEGKAEGKATMTLYPIGAGDTVAAGTLAAMLYFRNMDDERGVGEGGGARMRKDVRDALDEYKKAVAAARGSSAGGRRGHMETAEAVASFAFGLACGSASCLKQENSVLDVNDALRLFTKAAAASE